MRKVKHTFVELLETWDGVFCLEVSSRLMFESFIDQSLTVEYSLFLLCGGARYALVICTCPQDLTS